MVLTERKLSEGLTPEYPSSASATIIVLEEEARLREKAFLSGIREHLNRNSQGLETFFGTIFSLSESEVPRCPDFMKSKSPEGLKIEDGGKKTIIPVRIPLLVPNIPVEQLARVFGVDTALIEGTRSVLRSSLWVLAGLNLSSSHPETEKPDSDGLFASAFDGRVYAAYKKFMMHATGGHPDRETRTILDRTYIGGWYPRVGGGEKLEITTGLSPNISIENTAIKNTGWRVFWTAQREGI